MESGKFFIVMTLVITVFLSGCVKESTTDSFDYRKYVEYNNKNLNDKWVSEFFQNINTFYRVEPLTKCHVLDQFAKIRFENMSYGNNWKISHYGWNNDSANFKSKYYGEINEEYFYPDREPSDFIKSIQYDAPEHWRGFLEEEGFINYDYYGYYIGKGPVYQFNEGASSCSGEILGEVDQDKQFSNCNYEISQANWFVIELSNNCEVVVNNE